MGDPSSWPNSAATLGGHCATSAAPQNSSTYYQPPTFSTNLPSYTVTHTFTFPPHLSPASTPTTQSLSESRSEQTSHLQPPPPSLSFPPRESSTSASSAALFTSPVLSHLTAAAVSPSYLSKSSSSPPTTLYPPSSFNYSSSASSSSSTPVSRSGLSASERKARRAAKHRAIDLTRRTRELATLSQLKQLLSPLSTSSGSDNYSEGNEPRASGTPSANSSNATVDSKAAVLEKAVTELMQLRAVIAAQQAMLSGQTVPLHRGVCAPLPHALSPEWSAIYIHHMSQHSPPRTASADATSALLSQSFASSAFTSLSSDLHTIYSSFFLHSPFHLTLIQPGTTICFDANNAFLSHVRLPRDLVVGKRITLCPAARLLLDRGGHIPAEEFMGGRGVNCDRDRQASNGLNLVRLYSGVADTVFCVFRYVLGDGRVVDARGRCWLTKGQFSGIVSEGSLVIVQHGEDDYSIVPHDSLG